MSADPTPPVPMTPLPAPKRLSGRERLLVLGAGFGAFWIAAIPVGLLLLVAQSEEIHSVFILAVGLGVGLIFAATAGLVAYLVIKT